MSSIYTYSARPRLPSDIVERIVSISQTRIQRDKQLKVVHRMYNMYDRRKHPLCDYIPLSKDYKRELLGNYYYKTFKVLIEAGIIEVEKFIGKNGELIEYRPPTKNSEGKTLEMGHCKYYRFNQDIAYSSLEPISYTVKEDKPGRPPTLEGKTTKIIQGLTIDFTTEDQIIKFLDCYFEENKIANKIRSGVKTGQGITADRIRINGTREKRSTSEVLKIYENTNFTLVEYTWRKRTRYTLQANFQINNFIRDRVQDLYGVYYRQLEKLLHIEQRANINCNRNQTNGRLDHNLTNYKSDFLHFTKLDKEKLVGIDLKNSQFTIFANLIDQIINDLKDENSSKSSNNIETSAPRDNPHKLRLRISKKTTTQPLICHIKKNYPNILTIPPYPQLWPTFEETNCRSNNYSDIFLFLEAARSGKFYELVAKRLFNIDPGVGTEKITKEQREHAKKAMFEIFFDTYTSKSKTKDLLAKEFPVLLGLVDGFKKYLYDNHFKDAYKAGKEAFKKKYGARARPSKVASNFFPILLQSIESEIFVDGILKKLLKQGFRVLSKHDSILCKGSDLPLVKSKIQDYLDSVFGVGNYQLEETFY